MGVPEKLLRRLESEKAAVASFNERKQTEQARKTHKRMTIVAGTYARRKLLSPSGLDTRPMMGMVRGATFDMVMALIGSASNVQFPDPSSRWLDLFAGTGAIGLEAMSRGCVESHFVEMDPWVTNNVLEKNIKSLGLTRSDARVHTSSVEARSIHWSPYDPVRVVNADPYGLFPACLSAHPSLSIPALDAFQLQLTPMNSTPPSLCMERP
jgi:16S rRNA (guanine(966)-N(2))-methyltransferase RsmD